MPHLNTHPNLTSLQKPVPMHSTAPRARESPFARLCTAPGTHKAGSSHRTVALRAEQDPLVHDKRESKTPWSMIRESAMLSVTAIHEACTAVHVGFTVINHAHAYHCDPEGVQHFHT